MSDEAPKAAGGWGLSSLISSVTADLADFASVVKTDVGSAATTAITSVESGLKQLDEMAAVPSEQEQEPSEQGQQQQQAPSLLGGFGGFGAALSRLGHGVEALGEQLSETAEGLLSEMALAPVASEDDEGSPAAAPPSSPRAAALKIKLLELRERDATFTTPVEGTGAYEAWAADVAAVERAVVRAQLELEADPVMVAKFAALSGPGPEAAVAEDAFWRRYLFQVAQLEAEQGRKEALFSSSLEGGEEDEDLTLSWDSDGSADEPVQPPPPPGVPPVVPPASDDSWEPVSPVSAPAPAPAPVPVPAPSPDAEGGDDDDDDDDDDWGTW